MSILTKGENIIFVNTAADFRQLFTKLNATSNINENSTAGAADTLLIGGYATIALAALTGTVSGERPRPATLNKITIDAANAAQIKLKADFTEGAVIRFMVITQLQHGQRVEFYKRRASLGSSGGPQAFNNQQYGKEHFFSVKLRAGDTEATVLQRLAESISYNTPTMLGTSDYSATYTPGAANAPGIFSLEAKDADFQLSLLAYDKSPELGRSSQLAAFAPVEAVPAFEGVGQYSTLMQRRLETSARNEPYAKNQYDSPQEGRSYTAISCRTVTQRPDLTASEVADGGVASSNNFAFYVANGNEAWVTALVNYLARAAATVSKVYTGSDGQPKTQAEFLADVA